MKKYLLLLIMGALVYSVNAQISNKSKEITSKDLTWINTQDENTVIPKNPNANMQQEINATATCFCVVSYNDLTDQQNRSGVCMDLTSIVNTSYGGAFPEKDDNRKDCARKCSDAAMQLTAPQKQAIADCACSAGLFNGTTIRSYSAVGTKRYQSDASIGILINTPQVTQATCNCPTGWAANTTNVDGGVTADGKCKKLVCGPISTGPFPANGTQVGNWGFTWGNALYAWGSSANGGAPICKTVVVSPAVCKLQ